MQLPRKCIISIDEAEEDLDELWDQLNSTFFNKIDVTNAATNHQSVDELMEIINTRRS